MVTSPPFPRLRWSWLSLLLACSLAVAGEVPARGVIRALAIRIQFSDRTMTHHPAAVDRDILGGQVDAFLAETSHGACRLSADVVEPVIILGPVADYEQNPGKLYDDALAQLGTRSDDPTHDLVILVFPPLAGERRRAWVSGNRVHFNGNMTFHVAAHEIGHTLGLQHASSWQGVDGNVLGDGFRREYGDPFDIMGSGVTENAHFNPRFQLGLGWLDVEQLPLITEGGTYRIHRFDHGRAVERNPLALRVRGRGGSTFWISFRGGMKGYPGVEDGACIHWEGGPAKGTLLVDMTPGTSTVYDAGLPIGGAFSDPGSGVTIRPVARGGETPFEYLDVAVEVKDFGSLAAWGGNADGQLFFPEGLDDAVWLAGGLDYSLALLGDGSVIAWGSPAAFGPHPSRVPADIGDVVALWAGPRMAVALRSDGTLRHWGWAWEEGLGTVAGLESVLHPREVAVGHFHVLVHEADGRLLSFGHDDVGQAGPPPGLDSRQVDRIAAGAAHSLALLRSGKVVAWGDNALGQCEVPPDLSNVVAIAAGEFHSVALCADGTVVEWGFLSPAIPPHGRPRPPDLGPAVGIAAGDGFTAVQQADGRLVVWGQNNGGQCDVPPDLGPVRLFAVGYAHALAVRGRPGSLSLDAWRMAHRLGRDVAVDSDSDADGWPLWAEYAIDGDPSGPDPGPVPILERTGDGVVCSWVRPAYVDGIDFQLQGSGNLRDWSEIGWESATLEARGVRMAIRLPVNGQPMFLKPVLSRTDP